MASLHFLRLKPEPEQGPALQNIRGALFIAGEKCGLVVFCCGVHRREPASERC